MTLHGCSGKLDPREISRNPQNASVTRRRSRGWPQFTEGFNWDEIASPETQQWFKWKRKGAFRPACTRWFTRLKFLQHPEQKPAGMFRCRLGCGKTTPLDKIPNPTEGGTGSSSSPPGALHVGALLREDGEGARAGLGSDHSAPAIGWIWTPLRGERRAEGKDEREIPHTGPESNPGL